MPKRPLTPHEAFGAIRMKNQINLVEEPKIFSAIRSGNTRKVSKIIRNDPSVLEQKDSTGKTPIFYAIHFRNPKIVRMIIKKNQGVLSQTNKDELTPISLATSISYRSQRPEETKEDDSRILKIILKEQFKEKINEEDQKDLKELFLIKSLLGGIYSNEGRGSRLNIFKNAFDLLASENAPEKATPENSFDKTSTENSLDKIYKELFEKVDKNESIDLNDGEKIYAFSSYLKPHQSFFIFHVDKDNKLTSISYCDGNSVGKERKIEGSKTHINGVTTFNLEAPIEYNNYFAKNFIDINSKGKSTEDFYKKFKNKEIEIDEAKIDHSKTTHSIPTKIQRRGNCVFKSTSLLARLILEKRDPSMNLGFDMAIQKPIGAGYDEYEKFKDDLTIKAVNFLINLKEKISSKSGELNKHLKEEIEDIINITKENANRKLTLGLEELDELARLKLSSKPEEHDKTARLSKKRKSTSDWEELHEIERPAKKRMLKSYLEELDETARQKKEEDLMARGAHHKKIVDILSGDKSIAEEKSHPGYTFSTLDSQKLLEKEDSKSRR